MKKFILNNQKKLVALFSALLMIIFMLPSNRGANTASARLVGTIDGKSVYSTDLQQSKNDWQVLRNITWVQNGQEGNALLEFLESEQPAYIAIDSDPNKTAFYLLDVEARQAGIEISDDEINSYLVDRKVTSPDPQEAVVQALAHVMRVEALIDRAAGAIQIPEQQVRRALATDAQQVWLNVVEFPADNYRPTTTPSNQDVQNQYDRFVDHQPGQYNAQAGDPYGFGYTDPERIKYQYIEIPHDQVVESVKASLPPIQWAADEITYRREHPGEFPNPTTMLSKPGPTSAPSLVQLPWPSTQPFDDTNMPIFKRISQDKVDDLTRQIQSRIVTQMAADYAAWNDARNNHPAKPPVYSVGVPYDSPDYLPALKAAIEKDTPNFIAKVALLDNFGKTQKELAEEPGIGNSSVIATHAPFPEYLFTSAAPLQPVIAPATGTLQIMAPSAPLIDSDGNIYLCRITAADKAAPQHLSIVMDQVVQDVNLLHTMDIAHSAAQSLADAVHLTGDLAKSAADLNHKVLAVGPFVPTQNATIDNYPLQPESTRILIESVRNMLLSPTLSATNMPLTVLDLPPDHKVVLIQLDAVTPAWTTNTFAGKVAAAQNQLYMSALQPFLLEWCNVDAVSKRLNYHSTIGQ